MRLVKVICVLALVFAMSAIAYAETQSVKVSGAITERAFARGNYDLESSGTNTGNGISNDWSTFMQSTAEVQVDADLTDNVSGVIRLVNERVWGDNVYANSGDGSGLNELIQTTPEGDMVNRNVGGTAVGAGADTFSVDVDLAYIELKEFLYSPLTLRIGRQDLWFGRGFIIGKNLTQFRNNIFAAEYTAVNSFDAVRATLDYDPWTIDLVYAKITENGMRADDDVNLWGANVGYVFDSYNADIEGYFWMKQDRNPGGAYGTSVSSINGHVDNNVYVVGGRTSVDPIEDWTVAFEGAYQFGQYLGTNLQQNSRRRSAWAIDAMVECRYWQDDFAWKPVVAAEYIYYSGNDNYGDRNSATASGDYEGWDTMYRGKFDTAIREFQNVFYRTAQASSPSFTNQHQILVWGTIEPTDSLTFTAKYAHFWLAEDFVATNTKNNIGDELDLNLVWDYTEDVSFGLLAAWFFPGSHWINGQDDIATDVVGTVKLSF